MNRELKIFSGLLLFFFFNCLLVPRSDCLLYLGPAFLVLYYDYHRCRIYVHTFQYSNIETLSLCHCYMQRWFPMSSTILTEKEPKMKGVGENCNGQYRPHICALGFYFDCNGHTHRCAPGFL